MPGLAELAEVVTDGGFGQVDAGGEIAGAHFAAVGGEQDRYALDADRIGEGLEA